MQILSIYLSLINALALLLMLADKIKAKRHRWRIPEVTLMTAAALGGSVGCLIGMYAFRHKTKHPKFTVGVPLILAVQAILAVVLMARF